MFAECKSNLQLLVVGRQVLGERLFRFAMQRSFYGHFVAGATEAEVARSAATLSALGVRCIMCVPIEEDSNAKM